jgi:hypothetical protein
MQFHLSKAWRITLIILVILMILNPTVGDFKAFRGYKKSADFRVKKKANFLIASVYYDTKDDYYYIGVLKNFIFIKNND